MVEINDDDDSSLDDEDQGLIHISPPNLFFFSFFLFVHFFSFYTAAL
jgi:hypothetical protein